MRNRAADALCCSSTRSNSSPARHALRSARFHCIVSTLLNALTICESSNDASTQLRKSIESSRALDAKKVTPPRACTEGTVSRICSARVTHITDMVIGRHERVAQLTCDGDETELGRWRRLQHRGRGRCSAGITTPSTRAPKSLAQEIQLADHCHFELSYYSNTRVSDVFS